MENRATACSKIVKELCETYTYLTQYEALRIVAEFERNAILKAAFSVHENDAHPPALEAVAMALSGKPLC